LLSIWIVLVVVLVVELGLDLGNSATAIDIPRTTTSSTTRTRTELLPAGPFLPSEVLEGTYTLTPTTHGLRLHGGS